MSDYYRDGYNKGYREGRAGKPHIGRSFLDILNTKTQQEWEDGYEQGYLDGREDRLRYGKEHNEYED